MTYEELVARRKACHLCEGLTNPADGPYAQYDSDEIGAWSLWQGNRKSRVMVVGQDWGDTSYFLKWKGRGKALENPTNKHLQALLTEIGYHIGGLWDKQEQVEPATHGFSVRDSACKSLIHNGLQAFFVSKTRVTSG